MTNLNSKKYITNFYTCANNIYKDFVPLFITSNLFFNKGCHVEVGIDDEDYRPIKDTTKIIRDSFSEDFLIKKVSFDFSIKNKKFKIIPNTVRFLIPPAVMSKFIYISDIDIINLEKDIYKIHLDNMKKTGLPYSNIVRPNNSGDITKYRLSGLHFSPYEKYYPIPEFNDLCNDGFLIQDELFLYQLVKKRHPNFKYEETFRPVHGIHVSPNRDPNGKISWGMKDSFLEPWKELRNSDIFLKIEPKFTDYIKEKIAVIDERYSI